MHALPSTVESKDAVLLADIFPTSYEVGVLNGSVRPGDTGLVDTRSTPTLLCMAAAGRLSTA